MLRNNNVKQQIQVIQPSTIKVWVLLLILLHPHTYKEEGIDSSFLDNSEISINMKQTNTNRNIWNTSTLQQGHLPWHKLPTQHEISVATCNISSNKILVCIAIQLLPVFTCYLQSVCRASLSIPTSLLRNFLSDSKARTPTSSLLAHTELDYRNYLSFSFDG